MVGILIPTVTNKMSSFFILPTIGKADTKMSIFYGSIFQIRSTVAHWYAICFALGGPGFKSQQGRELLLLL